MNQMNLTDIYRQFHPNTKEYTFFSAPHGTFSKTDHILGNKATSTNKKKIGITCGILSDHYGLKLEFNSNTNCRKPRNSWKLNSAQFRNKKRNSDFLKLNKNEGTTYPNL